MFQFVNKVFSLDIRNMLKTTPGKVIIIQDKDSGVTEAGIIYKVNKIRDKAPTIPDPPYTGTVVAVGADTEEDYLTEEVKVGSKVHFEWIGGVFMQYEDQEYLVLQSRRITAVEL